MPNSNKHISYPQFIHFLKIFRQNGHIQLSCNTHRVAALMIHIIGRSKEGIGSRTHQIDFV